MLQTRWARPHYDLLLDVDPAKQGYRGKVEIRVQIAKPIQTIWFNATGIDLLSAHLEAGTAQVPGELVKGDEDFAGFRLTKPLATGEATLSVTFRGRFAQTSTRGLFRQEDQGHWYVFSQFEAISARRAFPASISPNSRRPGG
ncbi:MAG TPA: hypothetical protein VKA53_06030 [Thermoanaerobaculia bacterium]|nr:hypothetical protein [Thermoanaerobaculia bacterium]